MALANNARKARVLWIDDCPSQILRFVFALRHSGHSVKVVDAIDDRIPRPMADHFDLVLVDFRLPNEFDLSGPQYLLKFDSKLQDASTDGRLAFYVVSALSKPMLVHMGFGQEYAHMNFVSKWNLSEQVLSSLLSAEGFSW